MDSSVSFQKTMCNVSGTLLDSIRALQESPNQFVVVVDNHGTLEGTITDGDVRRALLKGVSFQDPLRLVMNSNPVYLDSSSGKLSNPEAPVSQVPVVDISMKVIGVKTLDGMLRNRKNKVVLMAGGKGTRLMPYTQTTPKPLVEIHGKALIEMLIERFVACGFSEFLISVNHLAEQIMERLGDGSQFGASIEYIRETVPLGTAGALALYQGDFEIPLVVANADLVTACDFGALLDFHNNEGATLTVATRPYSHSVPFGVVEISNDQVVNLSEKPTWTAQVAAGIYCISPSSLSLIQKNSPMDMPELVLKLISKSPGAVSAFPIHEKWHDVGRPEDLENLRLSDNFGRFFWEH